MIDDFMSDLEYIKPYKRNFFISYQRYIGKIRRLQNNNETLLTPSLIAISVLRCFADFVCCIQIGSGTNLKRVKLINDFEKFLLQRAIRETKKLLDLKEKRFKEYLEDLFTQKLRKDLFDLIYNI